jgi:hypothetical protein
LYLLVARDCDEATRFVDDSTFWLPIVAIVAVSSPNDIDMNDDGFILHTSRNKKKRKGKFYALALELTEEQQLERLLVNLESKRKQVEEHREWWSQWRGVFAVWWSIRCGPERALSSTQTSLATSTAVCRVEPSDSLPL